MHELSIINKIIKEAKKQGQVSSIMLEVGELSNIEPQDLEFHLRELVDWKITVNTKKSLVTCNCGYKGQAQILDKGHGYCIYKCPKCKEKPRVLDGGEIKIIGIN